MKSTFVILTFATVLSGAACSSDDFSPRSFWGEGTSGSGLGPRGLLPGRNFYKADLDRYPGYGIVIHTTGREQLDPKSEQAAFRRAIEVCRKEFGVAYKLEAIKAFDGLRTHQDKSSPPGEWFVPFVPEHIAVILQIDISDNTVRPDSRRAYAIGFIVDAKSAFGEINPDELFRLAYREESPTHEDPHGITPGYQTIYHFIERFRGRRVLLDDLTANRKK